MTENHMVRIFDTTLRDGEQAAGINLNREEKLQVALRLAKMNVDIIEAGFPAASPGDFEAVKLIADTVKGPVIAGLARTRKEDIRSAAEAVRSAGRGRIHTFIATSPIHMEFKLKMTPEQVLGEVGQAVTYARSLVEDVEFSAEDASRSDTVFLAQVFRTAADCGASTLNIPDTVGYAVPEEFGAFVRAVIEATDRPGVTWSVHCHNDLGMAVANSMAAVRAGARQVECTVNGLGERAGNASLEEVVMGLRTRRDSYGCETFLDTTKLWDISSLVSRMTGFPVPPNKAVVGSNAFAHEAGIHQHGVLCNRETYEIMNPEDVGAPGSRLVLGKHSGKHAFRQRVEEMGFSLSEEKLTEAMALFKTLCDRKEIVTTEDLEAMINNEILSAAESRRIVLKTFLVQVGRGHGTATVTLEDGGREATDAATGNGPVDAAYRAIRRIVGIEPELENYSIRSVTEASDATGEARITLFFEGIRVSGRGAGTDVIEASIKAYIDGINRLFQKAVSKGVRLYGKNVG
ncbi:2-isopropylmalate synthase [Aminivibrio sp.]|uniref:2-isopropylmalate synthase n=1 Tax=Aminivibrio sp. TaxID=1872489 RepID=UPI001A3A6B60|nr:2-isopropylmalate synthase [Aminivibrio sp.]MBL3539138.1 2-isopropylmalate synthase [Aminivibrio sp.]